jgi:hypothetical protein
MFKPVRFAALIGAVALSQAGITLARKRRGLAR